MRGFSDSLPLRARIRTAYNAGEINDVDQSITSGREKWTPILIIRGIVTIRHFASSRYVAIARGPTFGEISYALAEIKFEVAKSSSLKKNHKLLLKSEISPHYTIFP